MYVKQSPRPTIVTFSAKLAVTLAFTGLFFATASSVFAQAQVIRHITEDTQRLDITVNTSRILTLEKRVPKMVVNNPELVTITPISANQIQIAAKKPGVTQVNLWDEDGQVYTVDLMIYGDVRELELALDRLFPESTIKVVRLTNSLVLEGFVERPEVVGPIMRLAEDYAPKIVDNIDVGGVQQVLLKVKVMEVSRTKLRKLGSNWAFANGENIVASSLTAALNQAGVTTTSAATSGRAFAAGIVSGNNRFSMLLDALEENNVAKVLANPSIAAVSGRPARFNVGGELPIPVPSGQGQISIEYKEFGTQVDFVPIVLGNGNIRLEVRSEVSEVDETRGIVLNGSSVPAIKTSYVDTGVEMKAGQTLALAGLIQTRVDSIESGLPFVSKLPYVGAAFRSVKDEVSETELLIMVTPEYVDGMEPHQVPQCGPGMESVSPTNKQLYFGGHLEVPACGPCGPNVGDSACSSCGNGSCGDGSCATAPYSAGAAYASDAAPMPAIINQVSPPSYSQINNGQISNGPTANGQMNNGAAYQEPVQPAKVPTPVPDTAPVLSPNGPSLDPGPATGKPEVLKTPETTRRLNQQRNMQPRQAIQAPYQNLLPKKTAQRVRTGRTNTPGLMGPIGYDVSN